MILLKCFMTWRTHYCYYLEYLLIPIYNIIIGGPDLQGGGRGWGSYLHLWAGTH